MNNQEKIQIKTAENPDVVHSVDESRRSFSKKGLIAPVIMTLANRSAWGANACIGSGFQSYSTAKRNDQNLSHAAPQNPGISKWRTPQEWLDDLASWQNLGFIATKPATTGTNGGRNAPDPSGYVVYSVSANDFVPKQSSPTIINYKKTEVQGLGYAFANDIPSTLTSTYTASIYVAFDANANNLRAFHIATAMNMIVEPFDNPPDFSLFSKNDFVLFYSECTG